MNLVFTPHVYFHSVICVLLVEWTNMDGEKNNTMERNCVKEGLIGGQSGKWDYDVREDLRKMKIQIWIKMAADREAWKRMAKQAEAYDSRSGRRRGCEYAIVHNSRIVNLHRNV
jgi:hypothetical protein